MKKNLLFWLLLLPGWAFGQVADTVGMAGRVDSLIKISIAHTDKRDFEKALENSAAAEKLALEKLGRESAVYATCCHNQGRLYAYKNKFAEAEKWYLEAIAIRVKGLGKEHLDYATSVHGLANLYLTMGKYAQAEPLFLEAIQIREKTLGKNHMDYALSLNDLAVLFWRKGDYDQSERLNLEVMAIRGAILGKEHTDYASSLNALAIVYSDKADYAKAEQLYLEAKGIWAKTLGREHPDYARALNGLSILYKEIGEYDKAEPLYLEAIEIRTKTMGKEHPDYAASLNNYASFKRTTGDYSKAESLYLESLAIRAKVYGKEHPQYALGLNNLANLYVSTGEYAKAETLYLQSKEIRAKVYGKEHPLYAMCLNNLANLYLSIGEFAKAASLNFESKEIVAKTTGKEHPEYAKSLFNLSRAYLQNGDYGQVEPLLLEAKDICGKTLGKDHVDCILYLNGLTTLYLKMNRQTEAIAHSLEVNQYNRRLIEKAIAYSSEVQILAYMNTFEPDLSRLQSFSQNRPSPELNRACFDNALFFNGFLLENTRRLTRSVTTADSLTRKNYERWQSCQRRLAKLFAAPIAERDSTQITDLEEKANALEKDLARSVAGFGEALRQVNWQEVQAQLLPGEAAIEFVRYRFSNPEPTDSVLYAALLLLPGNTAPQFVPLFEEKQIATLLRGASGSNFLKINALYDLKSVAAQNPLDLLIWQPLENLLRGIGKVYCSPAGLLHRVNLAAVPVGGGQSFGERRQLVVLGSTRQLVLMNARPEKPVNDAYLAGGIRYDSDSVAIAAALQNTVLHRGMEAAGIPEFQTDSIAERSGSLDFLPSTAVEVCEIRQMLAGTGMTVTMDTGFFATEEAFRQLGTTAPSARVVHLATHGYFFPEPKLKTRPLQGDKKFETAFKTSKHPMMRSGLMLAGAKQVWLGGKQPQNREDGILTAYEISQMNLSGTELVVLSACETGLGDLVGNEGVFGLQRSFKIAGARYLIMSLWKVDDRSSQAFMAAFYRHWLPSAAEAMAGKSKKTTVPEAFRKTQSEMRAKFADAYDWAGFVLVE